MEHSSLPHFSFPERSVRRTLKFWQGGSKENQEGTWDVTAIIWSRERIRD